VEANLERSARTGRLKQLLKRIPLLAGQPRVRGVEASDPEGPRSLVAAGLHVVPRSAAICLPASLIYAWVQGASDFLLKPFEPGELLCRVARAFAEGRS
jgi:hypothetical protein